MPTFNQARTIRSVIDAARAVLDAGFPGMHGRIVVADGGSTDETPAAARAAGASEDLTVLTLPGHASEVISLPYHGIPGRSRALWAVAETVRDSGARAVAVIDGTSAAPNDRIMPLLRPVLSDGFDFVAPAYRRSPFAGTLVKSIIQPFYRTCYGLRLRQPTGPEFACSRRMVDHLLQPRVWPRDAGDVGIDLWLSTTAAAESFAVCEVAVGARARSSRDDTLDVAGTLAQVVGALFTEVDRRAAAWQRVRASKAVPLFNGRPVAAAEATDVDPGRLLDRFRLGYRELSDVWAEILRPATILEFRRLAAVPEASFRMPDRSWARTVYDFAVGHRHRVMARDHLLRALAPLYLGWVASLVLECGAASEEAVEARVDRLCEEFEAEKPYLISRWRWPERFRPR